MAVAIDVEGLVVRLERFGGKRSIVGIAGAPGSGKSTIAAKLELALNSHRPRTASILPMDGFHYDDGLLNELGRRGRKGASDTFDVGGLVHTIQRLRNNTEDAVAVPVFDRDLEISRGSARLISNEIPIIIVEGNYLLLTRDPWSTLRPLFDMTVMVESGGEILRQRLVARWESYNLPAEEVRRKVEEIDLPNGRFVIAESAIPDHVLAN